MPDKLHGAIVAPPKSPKKQRARVKARAQELIEEELTLRDLRQARHLDTADQGPCKMAPPILTTLR